MIEPRLLGALRIIHHRLAGTDIVWAVTGSLGMALQGMDVSVHDIDLQTDRPGAYEIERRLSEFVAEPVRYTASESVRSHLGRLVMDALQVEIIGDMQKRLADGTWEKPVRVENCRCWVEVEGIRIPVLSLEHEYEAYRRMGRAERADRIKEWLESRTP